MKCFKTVLVGAAFAALIFGTASVQADWNLGDYYKMHYPQLPDLTPTGMDVLAGQQVPGIGTGFKILADDFRCIETGPINDVHIWGSWLNDRLPNNDARNVAFKLSIHSDIPAPPTGGFSMPGPELWSATFSPVSFTVRPVGSGPEQFYDPNIHQIIGTDNTVWQYNFTNLPNPYIQQQGLIYWLDVQALPLDNTTYFGWKTTNPQDPRTPHFMDDAVYADTAGFNGPLVTAWLPMVYPTGHPYAGVSLDMAFVITPEPASLLWIAGATFLMAARRRRQT